MPNGTSGNDIISGGETSDVISGGDGNDILYGYGPGDVGAAGSAITATAVVTGLTNPVALVAAPGDTGNVYVVTKDDGIIHRIDPATGARTTFLDIPNTQFISTGEQGVLGLAFDPNYASNGEFYVFLTNPAGDLEVRRYTRSAANPAVADPASATTIITVPHPIQSNHNGGWIGFGPNDGYLYISTGDGGGGGDPNGNAQNTNSLLGKILRIDVHGDAFPSDPSRNYAIPATNPFVGTPGADEIFAYGLRNPWRASFDVNGDLYIGDVGQERIEEVDIITAGTSGAVNFGWNILEGTLSYSGAAIPPGLTAPIFQYDHSQGVAIAGGAVYRGPTPGLQGAYLFADTYSGRIWSLRPNGAGGWETIERTSQITSPGGPLTSIVAFGTDTTRNLYAVSLGGTIYRLDMAAGAGDGNDTISGGNGNDELWGGAGTDSLTGDAGNDRLNGGTGANVIGGGGGWDRLTYASTAAAAALVRSTSATWTITGASFSDAISGVEVVQFSDRTVALREAGRSDISGDGSGDIAWYNSTARTISYYEISSAGGYTWHNIGSVSAGYTPRAGDFNGDGRADILWSNSTSVSTYLLNADGTYVWRNIGGVTAGYTPIVGDFNGDGTSDILWTNGAQVSTYLIDPTTGNYTWRNVGTVSAGYTPYAGDFNGDGTSDILWTNGSQVSTYLINPTTGNYTWRNVGGVANGYAPLVGDFSGDGASDIAWWNQSTGAVSYYEINPTTGSYTWHDIGGVSAGYTPFVRDFNNDGKADIGWTNGTYVSYYDINPAGGFTWRNIGGVGSGNSVVT